jgi:heterotetrameric sarcosine oxidase gamma subunit
LLKVSELKNLAIIQLVHYKNSKSQLANIEIENLKFPIESSKVSSNKQTRILWHGPKTWLIISSSDNIIKEIQKSCDTENFAITDISHSRAVLQIKGFKAKEVLKKGCPINFNEFNSGNCANTVFNGISVAIDLINNDPDTFNILTLRSFGESFYHHITDSALEFGYVGI